MHQFLHPLDRRKDLGGVLFVEMMDTMVSINEKDQRNQRTVLGEESRWSNKWIKNIAPDEKTGFQIHSALKPAPDRTPGRT